MWDKLQKFNQLAFTLAAISIAASFGYDLYKKLTFKPYQPPKIEIITSSKEKPIKPENLPYVSQFDRKIKDTLFFQIFKKTIIRNPVGAIRSRTENIRMRTQGVNIAVWKGESQSNLLFDKDVFITGINYMQFPQDKKQLKQSKNIYLAALEDTNNDNHLSRDDDKTLFISDYDGSNLKPLFNKVTSYRLIADETLIITQKIGTQTKHIRYHLISSDTIHLNIPH